MKRTDSIKLDVVRNWPLPGKQRLSSWLKPSEALSVNLKGGIVWLNKENIAIHTSVDSYIEWNILTTGTYEDDISKLIRISLKNGDTALDIGGNIGLQSIRMSQCVGTQGQVFAFEPLEHLQKKFLRNIALNRAEQVTLLPIALSDTAEDMEFSIDRRAWNQGAFSLNDVEGVEKQKVSVRIADSLELIRSLTHLALVKIDVEGFEFRVILGLTETLKRLQPRIIFEYDVNYWQRAGQQMKDCFAFLEEQGYEIYQVTPVGCERIWASEDVKDGNLFCIYAH